MTTTKVTQSLITNPFRTVLTANTTYYVATTGNDSTGTGTSSLPWLTIQHALNYIQQSIDLGGYTATVSVASGTYTGTIYLTAPFTGSGSVQLLGNTTTPTNCVISVTNYNAINVTSGAVLSVSGFQSVTNGSGYSHLVAQQGGIINLNGNWNFGAAPSNSSHIIAYEFGCINVTTSAYTISGSAGNHMYCSLNSLVSLPSTLAVTLTGTPAFADFASVYASGSIYWNGGYSGVTYTGSATGQKYYAAANAVIATGGSAASYLPGSTAGATATGGLYL